MADDYSFCEGQFAGSMSKWHIRKLTEKGFMFGGGADTRSLCDHQVAWDINAQMNTAHIESLACPRCLKIYREATGR